MKTIVFLGAGPEQAYVLDLAQRLGYKTCVLDDNTSAIGRKFADIFIHCNINSIKDILKSIKNLTVDGIFAHAIELSYVVAVIAEKLGLPGIKPEAAINSTNKIKRLEIFKKNNIPCPDFGTSETIEESKKVAKDLTFPVVIKPADNAGSRGVIIIHNEFELEKYFDETKSYNKYETRIVIEKYMIGHQISSETVIHNKQFFTTGFSDRNYQGMDKYSPYFIEDGGDVPTSIGPTLKKKTIEIIEKTISALEINFGSAKGDLLISDDTPHVIEMASRTSGGRFATHQVPASTGVNILIPLLQMACGDPVDKNKFAPKFNDGCSQRYIIPKPGKIVSVSGLEEARKSEGVKWVLIDKDISVGAMIPQITSNVSRVGLVMAKGGNRQEAINNAEKARDLIKIKTIP